MLFRSENDIFQVAWGKESSKVEDYVKVSAVVQSGSWMVELPPQSAGEGYRMIVSVNNELLKEMSNIAIGEVWFCGGK